MDTLPLVAPEQVGLSAQRLDRVRKWPRAPPVTIATRPSHNLAIAPSRFCRVWRYFPALL